MQRKSKRESVWKVVVDFCDLYKDGIPAKVLLKKFKELKIKNKSAGIV